MMSHMIRTKLQQGFLSNVSSNWIIKNPTHKKRNEKNPISTENKDDQYFERRKRNNEAAKKSRDARKLREDRVAFKAALLERENAILKSQILILREELYALAQTLI
ncbi:transcription factor ces-2 [Malaya genurostris]|uniref:transcription factor ces-2 n=1 Tax=Malaya genurostris TaxID=325434 RepID=UPI0026F3D046|nr:transcription factor ces-2 [Malaya genurostris]